MTGFILDDRINASSHLIDIYDNIQIRITDDKRFFWLLLVPQIDGLSEWHDIDNKTMQTMHGLITQISSELERSKQPDKINIGALGNIVSQFHLHIVLRYTDDAAWPGPIWGKGEAVPLDPVERRDRIALISGILAK